MKKAFLVALIPAALLLSGCDDEAPEVCRYYIQNDIDKAQFQSAIDRLSDEDCQATYPDDEYLIDLSSAYLGKAGLALPVILRAMIEDEDSSDELTFQSFVTDITDSAEPSVLSDLNLSRSALEQYLDYNSCKSIESPNSAEETVCLITGFIDVLKTTMAIDVMTGGDVASWSDDSIDENPAMLRSSCALKYSYEHKFDEDFSTPYERCEDGVTIDESESVTFISDSGTTKTYNHLTITFEGESEYFLESTEVGSTVFTQEYCAVDYAVCSDVEAEGCYSCPMSQEEDLTTKDYLLDALNNGFDSIESVIANSNEDEDGDIQQSIDDFKLEIKSEGCSAVPEGEDCFTMDDIIDYLNNK